MTSLLMWFYIVVTIIVSVFLIICALLICEISLDYFFPYVVETLCQTLWLIGNISWSHDHTDIGNGDGHMCAGNCRELV